MKNPKLQKYENKKEPFLTKHFFNKDNNSKSTIKSKPSTTISKESNKEKSKGPIISVANTSNSIIKFSKMGTANIIPTRNHQPLKEKEEIQYKCATNYNQNINSSIQPNSTNTNEANQVKPLNKTNILFLNNNITNPFQSTKGNITLESPSNAKSINYNNHQSFPLPSPNSQKKKHMNKKPKADTFQVNKRLNDFLKKGEEEQQFKELSKAKCNSNKYSLFSFPEMNSNSPSNNAQIPYEYFNDFLETFCKEEKCLEFKILPSFMLHQSFINNYMRAIVVNWIIEVHNRFNLLPDTLFLSVILFDRYMSLIKSITKSKLQLIGVTSLLLACKYEEIFSPEVRDFVCILDKAYEREDLMDQENKMMKHLKFEVTYPSSLKYYEILRLELGIEDSYYDYGCYLLEITLLDCRFSEYSQALLATTVCYMLLKFQCGEIPDAFYENIQIELNDVKRCLVDICYIVENIEQSNYNAVVKKYKNIAEIIRKKVCC